MTNNQYSAGYTEVETPSLPGSSSAAQSSSSSESSSLPPSSSSAESSSLPPSSSLPESSSMPPSSSLPPSSSSSSSSSKKPCKCPQLTDFKKILSQDIGGGTLQCGYSWKSSTGNLSDLKGVFFEEVKYPGGDPYSPPDPPFENWNALNPTILGISGTEGRAMDTHRRLGGFSIPYKASGYSATQNYYYTCECGATCCVVLIQGPITIKRSVGKDANGTWYYKIEKDGGSAVMNLPNPVVRIAPTGATKNPPVTVGNTRRELYTQFVPFEGLSNRKSGRYSSLDDTNNKILVTFQIIGDECSDMMDDVIEFITPIE